MNLEISFEIIILGIYNVHSSGAQFTDKAY